MSATLKHLSDIKAPNLLDFDRIGMINEMIDRIKSDAEWNSNWDGELWQNSSFMIMNFFTFLYEKGFNFFNKAIKENFLMEGIDENSVLNVIFQRGISLIQNRHSKVTLTGIVVNDDFLTKDLIFPLLQTIFGTDLNGQVIPFEFISMAEDGKPDYLNPVTVPIANANRQVFNVDVYSGISQEITFSLDGSSQDGFFIDIPSADIIEDSIRIYYEFGTVKQIELPEYFSFVKKNLELVGPQVGIYAKDFPYGVPGWIAKFNGDGSVRIFFGTKEFGGTFGDPSGKNLTIKLRTGGGKLSNIVSRGIDTNLQVDIGEGLIKTIAFINENFGGGGADREDILQIRQFAALRTGREKAIVNDQDVVNNIYHLANKVKSDSPFYNELGSRTQLLHTHNFIVPDRDLSVFGFPLVTPDDTIESYNTKFKIFLNEYLNLTGIKDKDVVDEFVSTFKKVNDSYDYAYSLKYKRPLNTTLSLNAYDFNGNLIDRMEFDTNYGSAETGSFVPFTSINPTTKYGSAKVISRAINTSNPLTISSFNSFQMMFDKIAFFNLSFTANGIYTSATALATELNLQIRGILSGISEYQDYFTKYVNHVWVYADGETIVFQSPTIGNESSIFIKANSTNDLDILKLLEIDADLYRANPSGKIFDPATTYDHQNSEVNFVFRKDSIDKVVDVDAGPLAVQNPSEATGTEFEILIKDENESDREVLQSGQQLIVEALDAGDVVLDRATFTYGTTETNTPAFDNSFLNTTRVFDTGAVKNFNYPLSQLNMKFRDSESVPNSGPAVPPYTAGFPVVGKLVAKYVEPIENTEEIRDNGIPLGNTNYTLSKMVIADPATTLSIKFYNEGPDALICTVDIPISNPSPHTTAWFPITGTDTVTVIGKVRYSRSISTNLIVIEWNEEYTLNLVDEGIEKIEVVYLSAENGSKEISDVSLWAQQANSPTGPVVSIQLLNDSNNPIQILENSELTLEAYDSIGTTVIGEIVFSPISLATTIGTPDDVDIFKPTGQSYDYGTAILTATFIDSVDVPNTPVPPYLVHPNVALVTKIRLTYKRQAYSVITCDYKQNIYLPEGEAKAISDIIMAKNKRMQTIHHLIRSVEFIPLKIQANLKISKNISPRIVEDQSRKIITDVLGYSNTNDFSQIGEGADIGYLASLLNRTEKDYNPGILSAQIIVPEVTKIEDSSTLKNQFYFVFDEAFINLIKSIEQGNPNIAGFYKLYQTEFKIERV